MFVYIVVLKVRNRPIVVHSSLNVRQCCSMCDYVRIECQQSIKLSRNLQQSSCKSIR